MRAGLGELVQGEAATRELGMDGEEPGPGRGLEHEVGGCDRRRSAGGEAELDRGGELLERLALLRAAGGGGDPRPPPCPPGGGKRPRRSPPPPGPPPPSAGKGFCRPAPPRSGRAQRSA